MRKRLRKSFEENEAQGMVALGRRWGSTKHVQDMVELLAKLEGELSKEAAEGARGVTVGEDRPTAGDRLVGAGPRQSGNSR
jgi:hypothetical protein